MNRSGDIDLTEPHEWLFAVDRMPNGRQIAAGKVGVRITGHSFILLDE